jgi:hypothetical protein
MVMLEKETLKHNGALILELVEFITRYMYEGQERKIEKAVKKSLEYDIGDYGIDENGVAYVLRYEIKDNIADVTELIVRDDLRGNQKLLRYIISRNWMKHPYLSDFSFDRLTKYPERIKRKYNLLKYFKKGDNYGRNKNCPANASSSTDTGTIG